MGSTETQTALAPDFRYIPLSYSHADSQASALRLILTLNPDWEGPGNKIEFVRFTDGITNTLLKIINLKPGLTEEQIDNEAVLMRAYGNGTEILIDRESTSKIPRRTTVVKTPTYQTR
jgi:ethanolamine kinase